MYSNLALLGFRPLLATWGSGSYHLHTLFDRDIPGADLFAFGKWLVSDAGEFAFTKPIESFPKRAAVPARKYDNWSYLLWLLSLTNLTTALRIAVERQLSLQDRDDWLESAVCALPRITFVWQSRMRVEFARDVSALAVVDRGDELLRELCSEVTGQEFPSEPDERDSAD